MRPKWRRSIAIILHSSLISLILYDCYQQISFESTSPGIACLVKYTSLTPFQTYIKINYTINPNQLVNLSDFRYLINPKICDENETFLLIFVVHSDPKNVESRMAVRETWGKQDDVAKIVFVFGFYDDEDVADEIARESEVFGDIVQGNFLENYRNLTYKHVMALKWVAAHCSGARYVAKVDVDTFVHRRNLLWFLTREFSPWGTENLIAGDVWLQGDVLRVNDNKWYVKKHEFEPDVYPRYCSGMFIIYSQDVLNPIVEASQTTTYFFVDDVYVSGILPDKIGIPRIDITFVYLEKEEYATLINTESSQSISDYIFGPLNREPENMRYLWNITEAGYHNHNRMNQSDMLSKK